MRAFDWHGTGLAEHAVDRRNGNTLIGVHAEFSRPLDATTRVGDAAKARRQLGFSATTGVSALARLMVEAELH